MFKTDHEKKQEISLVKERKRLNLLEELKVNSGPFTNSDEVDNFLNDSMINDKDKQKRMKKEIQFARDSSTTLPKVSPLFKIRINMSDKKQRDKNAQEFRDALKIYLGKKEERIQLNYSESKEAVI